jgi:hypothetical protein
MIEAQEQEREDRELLGDMYSYKNYRDEGRESGSEGK